jgi:DNA-binding SARP family transcriptional activator
MSVLSISLFGKFTARRDGRIVKLPGGKPQELLSYLLVYRNRPHSREVLAETIWGDAQAEKNKKQLRQTLWQLNSILAPRQSKTGPPLLVIDLDWVQINAESGIVLDIASFDEAALIVQNISGRQLEADCARLLESAVGLYVGDLLECNYQDWCFYERERLQNTYLMLLDKLVCYYYQAGLFEKGLMLAYRILAIDGTHEKSHRQIMRFHYLSGNRPAALKQYEKCVEVLKQEMNVGPDKRTHALYEQLRSDNYQHSGVPEEDPFPPNAPKFSLSGTVTRLKKLDLIIDKIQKELRKELEIAETTLNLQ